MKQILFDELIKHSYSKIKKRRKPLLKNHVIRDVGRILINKVDSWKNAKIWGFFFFAFCILGVFLLFLGRAANLQVLYGTEYAGLAWVNRTRSFTIQAERGVIYDRNGEILVRNKPAFSIVMDTGGCLLEGTADLCVRTVDELSSYVDFDVQFAKKALQERKPNIVLVEGLSKEQVVMLETYIKSLSSVDIVTAPLRDYLYGNVFAHLIGYLGAGDTLYPSIEGKSGVEESYNEFLVGNSGQKIFQTDSSGEWFSSATIQEPTPGRNITLYIDLGLQRIAYEELKNKVEKSTSTGGAIVAQDPRTGGILAFVSYPAFDPESLSLGISSEEWEQLNENLGFPFFNRVISAGYPPGSTFKPVLASAALAEGVIGEYFPIVDNGYIQVGSYIFRNWKLEGHGLVDLRRALQVSNDTYFYTIGGGYGGIEGLGIEKIFLWAKKFGFGAKTGIDLSGEISGFMPNGTYRDWYLGDTYITSIGQGDVLATPLQVNNMMAYFANGGYLLRPRVVKNVDGVGGFDVEVLSQGLINTSIYETVREGLKMAVEPGGTGYPFFDFPQKYEVEVAGKTGTSEYIDKDGEENTHAWFTVFGPYENSNIVLTVFLEGGGSGSDDAAPIARAVLDYWFGQKNTP